VSFQGAPLTREVLGYILDLLEIAGHLLGQQFYTTGSKHEWRVDEAPIEGSVVNAYRVGGIDFRGCGDGVGRHPADATHLE